MKVTYGIVEEHWILNGGERISYGIAAYANAELDGTATVIASVSDITPNRQRLIDLVSRCNLLELSLIHLNDVIEDFLVD